MENKTEHGRFLINRFDHYYDTVNNKGAFYLGLNTFIVTGVTVCYSQCEHYLNDLEKILGYVLPMLLGFGSIAYTLFAINPFLKSGNDNTGYRSMVFFGSIASFTAQEFISGIGSQTDEQIRDDMFKQAYQLAVGLNTKFTRLRVAGYLLMLEFFSVVLTLIFTYKHI